MTRLTPITKREQVSGTALTAFDAIIESRNPAEKPCCDEMRRRLTSGLGQV